MRNRLGLPARALAVVMLAALLALPGCVTLREDQVPEWLRPTQAKRAPQAAGGKGTETVSGPSVMVYFVRKGKLCPVRRPVRADELNPDAALAKLMEGPNASERKSSVSSALPKGLEIRSMSVDGFNGKVDIDVSREFASGLTASSAKLRVAQIVCTLTEFSNVRGVVFRIEGKRVEHFGPERIDMLRPQTRNDYLELSGGA